VRAGAKLLLKASVARDSRRAFAPGDIRSRPPVARPMRRSHPVLWTLIALVIAGGVVAAYVVGGPGPLSFARGTRVALKDYSGPSPAGVPEELKSSSLIAQGEYLARAADCMVCHTARGGTPFAGGRAFVLPFGTMYSTNITPDVDTGIGRYSDQDFLNAVHKGIGRNGVRLYPAMPFASYTLMSDGDALAIKAYLFSLKPVHAPAPENTLKFPFNQRYLMAFWSAFFNPDRRFTPVTGQPPAWNRGAYLVEAMGHCGECHTPRNLGMALNNREKFAGAVQAGWRAYNITPDTTAGIGTWSDAELAHYLSMGHAEGRGTASGPMGEAIDESLSHLTASDIGAIVAYLRTVPAHGSPDLPAPRTDPASPSFADDRTRNLAGKAVYEGACAGCHGWSGISPGLATATLTGTRAINDPKANNVAQVILGGGQRHAQDSSVYMPGFGSAYSDSEVASVANYVTERFGAQGATLTAKDVEKMRAAQ
jgi:mono/diheme cytochrome c family protein